MTTLIKIIVLTILSLTLLCSCNFDISLNPGVKGNGNVVTDTRTVNGSFSSIKASEGLHVHLTQDSSEGITVEADENIQDLIITEVVDDVLKIHTQQNIGKASSKKVYVSFKNISGISSSSGSNVYSTNALVTDNLEIRTSSGSNMKLNVKTPHLNCKSSSGSNLRLSGNASKIIAEASSGSNIKASNLITESSHVKASSGANIAVNTSKELTAQASSGGYIKYYGDPEKVSKKNSSSGSIVKR